MLYYQPALCLLRCTLSPCGFGCQSGASGESGIDLDDAVLQGRRVQGVLNVTFAYNAEVTDNFDGCLPEHVVLLVGQRLARCNHYGVT